MTNPYASFLGDQDPVAVISATGARLEALSKQLGPSGFNRSLAPGKWTAREILCHLADCEVVFAVRLRHTLAEDHYVIQPFDQDQWARTYSAYSAPAALDVFRATRAWNVALVKAMPAAGFSKPVTHPERGTMTFRVLVETMAGHDINHLRQLDTIASGAAQQPAR
jgi:DinB family protein